MTLAGRFGWPVVHDAAFGVLGYPALWIDSYAEAKRLERAITTGAS